MDQDERIANLKAELRRLNGGDDPTTFGIDSMPKDMAEQFLRRVIAVETGQIPNTVEPLSDDGKAWYVAVPTAAKSK